MTTRAEGSIVSRLNELDMEERAISAERKNLHRQIDGVYLNAPLDDTKFALLIRLEQQERAVSAERRKLHTAINRLRGQSRDTMRARAHDIAGRP